MLGVRLVQSRLVPEAQSFFFFFFFFRAAPTTYGGSQARGPIGVVVAGLHHSHSNVGSELCMRTVPQLMATPDP